MSFINTGNYRQLQPLERVEHGDEFTWLALTEGRQPDEVEWYPVETFVGSRVVNLTKRANVIFRRALEEAQA